MKPNKIPSKEKTRVLRILDANLNRSREGLRVCEEIARFVWISKPLSMTARRLRHGISQAASGLPYEELLKARDSEGDIERSPSVDKKSRSGWQDLHRANIQRAKESLRVLEELSKWIAPAKSAAFKKIRFKLYEFEKRSAQQS